MKFLPMILVPLMCFVSVLASAEPIRVLHVMSYHSSWEWNKDQLNAFKSELNDLEVDYRIVELDGKRVSKKELQKRADDAIRIIEDWKPNLVYANDDMAQEYVTRKFVNHEIPFVFSAVNKRPADYGFESAVNITGVLEEEHFAPTISLLRSIKPGIKRIAIITDSDPTWQGVLPRIRQELKRLKDIEVVEWIQPNTFAEYKLKIQELQTKVDAIGLLGIFNFSEDGSYVDYEKVLYWTSRHSKLPDFSFWDTRVERGTLCSVTVSGIEQGREAGRIARRILTEKISPQEIQATATVKGRPMVSLARARALGINIPSPILLSAKVVTTYAWDE
jgi:ABC-type uncharacterized transport system substrate-binding protein